jgi:hypothetical protein
MTSHWPYCLTGSLTRRPVLLQLIHSLRQRSQLGQAENRICRWASPFRDSPGDVEHVSEVAKVTMP